VKFQTQIIDDIDAKDNQTEFDQTYLEIGDNENKFDNDLDTFNSIIVRINPLEIKIDDNIIHNILILV